MLSSSRRCRASPGRSARGTHVGARILVCGWYSGPSRTGPLSDAPVLRSRALTCRRLAGVRSMGTYGFAARAETKKTGLVGPASSASSWMRLHHSAARPALRVRLCSSGESTDRRICSAKGRHAAACKPRAMHLFISTAHRKWLYLLDLWG